MKNLIFKYKNGKFIVTEGYQTVKEIETPVAESIPVNSLAGIMKKNNITSKESAEQIIEIVSGWLQSNNITPDGSKLAAGLNIYDRAEVGDDTDDSDEDALAAPADTGAADSTDADTGDDDEVDDDDDDDDKTGDKEIDAELADSPPEKKYSDTIEKLPTTRSEYHNLDDDLEKQTDKSIQINIGRKLKNILEDIGEKKIDLSIEDMVAHLVDKTKIPQKKLEDAANEMINTFIGVFEKGNPLERVEFKNNLSRDKLILLYNVCEQLAHFYREDSQEKNKLTVQDKPSWNPKTGERRKPEQGAALPNVTDDDYKELIKRYAHR